MSSKIQRRDPCPCGSGKKYKNCCGKQGDKSDSKRWTGLKSGVLAIVLVGGGIAAYMILSEPTTTPPEAITTDALPQSVQPLQPQPSGPAPEGKVWSAEHGHWHDSSGAATSLGSSTNPISITPGTTPSDPGVNPFSIAPGATPKPSGGSTPQPAGPAPEGKVWSAEHGHWHDEPGTPGELTPPPPGTAPEGKVWSEEHGHWHDEPGAAGKFTPQPPGPAPEGKTWIPEHGHWHDASGAATPSGSGTNKINITPTKPPDTGSKEPE